MSLYRYPVISLVVLTFLGSCGSGGLPDVPDDAKGTAEAIIHNLVENKPGILWSAMPASYQKDINDIIQKEGSPDDILKIYGNNDKCILSRCRSVSELDWVTFI